MLRRSLGFALALSTLAPLAAGAADAAPPAAPDALRLPPLAGPIVLDGDPSEEAWRSAAVVDRFLEFAPGDQAEPPVATVGWLAHDAEYLYVAIRCADPDPKKLRAPRVDRDRVVEQDFVQIDVDARDEGRWSTIFRVNPHGVQTDGVFDETAGADDFSPDLHWESATRIGEAGWTAEMKIPISALRYRAGDPQTWRITFFRLYPREYRYAIASMPYPHGTNCWLCHATRFTDIRGLDGASALTFAPFVTTAASDAGAGGAEEELDGGADLKWIPHPNVAVDAALNPDFSQVEADAPQIAVNNRFALFYPEKRPFFLEGSDLWNSPIQAIHTRTVTDPDWGVRLTGRPGDASYTLLATGDRGGGTRIEPGPEGSGFAPQLAATTLLGRYRQTFGRSSIGALATVREGDADDFNRVGGVDFQWFPNARDRFVGQLLWSATRDPGGARADDSARLLRWERSQRHLAWTLQVDELGSDFRADSGFVPQTGIRHAQGYLEVNLYPQGILRRVRPRFYFDESRELDGDVVSRSPAVGLGVDGRLQATLDWYFDDRERADDGTLFEKRYWNLSARFLPSRVVPFVKLDARWGDTVDLAGSRLGRGADLRLAVDVHATDRLQAELSGGRRWLDVPQGGRDLRLFTATLARARLHYSFGERTFARLIGEWQSLEEDGVSTSGLSGSLLLGYRLDWQSTAYLGYDNTPAAGTGSGRRQELFLKVAYAFRPRFDGEAPRAAASRPASLTFAPAAPPAPAPQPSPTPAPEPETEPAAARARAAAEALYAPPGGVTVPGATSSFFAGGHLPRWYGVCPLAP